MRISDWSSDVCSSDLTDVHLDRLGATDAVDHPLLDRAQQLGLQADIHLADFVEQQGAAVGLLELADAARHRAGKGTLLVAEQFGFQQGIGDRRAVDRDEGALGARRLAMDIARRSEEHTSELQSLMRISYAVFCLKKTKRQQQTTYSK